MRYPPDFPFIGRRAGTGWTPRVGAGFLWGGLLRANICFLSIAEYDHEVYERRIFNVHRSLASAPLLPHSVPMDS